MKSLGKFPDSFLAEIAGQPEALRRAAGAVSASAASMAEVARAAASRPRVVLTGMGASHFAGYGPVTQLARAGVAAFHTDSAELLHFREGILDGRSLVIVTSQSGGSAEPVALAERLRARSANDRPFVVAVTNGLDNDLVRLADLAVDTRAGEERGPSTITFAACLVVLAALSEAVAAGMRGTGGEGAMGADMGRAAERAALAAERVLTRDPAGVATRLADRYAGRPMVVTLGRGGARAASEMGALVLKEAARLPAEALEAAQFRHGPLELAGDRLGAFVVATEPETHALDVGLARDLTHLGASVTLVSETDDTDGRDDGELHTVAIGRQERILAAAVSVIPMQLLAWRLSVARGFDPTDLHVASKVTTRE
jgi:glucosamine--fructose-6-phosphate aminotransferase (isomerizing)